MLHVVSHVSSVCRLHVSPAVLGVGHELPRCPAPHVAQAGVGGGGRGGAAAGGRRGGVLAHTCRQMECTAVWRFRCSVSSFFPSHDEEGDLVAFVSDMFQILNR